MKVKIICADDKFVEAEMSDDLAVSHPKLFKEMFDVMYDQLLAQLQESK